MMYLSCNHYICSGLGGRVVKAVNHLLSITAMSPLTPLYCYKIAGSGIKPHQIHYYNFICCTINA